VIGLLHPARAQEKGPLDWLLLSLLGGGPNPKRDPYPGGPVRNPSAASSRPASVS
jgi:hypothetical protein